VTVTWSPAPAPDRRPAVLPRALAAATDMIAPVLADVAITSDSAPPAVAQRDKRTYCNQLEQLQIE
jgi:hypothetical protein